jgi:hypothetical protein
MLFSGTMTFEYQQLSLVRPGIILPGIIFLRDNQSFIPKVMNYLSVLRFDIKLRSFYLSPFVNEKHTFVSGKNVHSRSIIEVKKVMCHVTCRRGAAASATKQANRKAWPTSFQSCSLPLPIGSGARGFESPLFSGKSCPSFSKMSKKLEGKEVGICVRS